MPGVVAPAECEGPSSIGLAVPGTAKASVRAQEARSGAAQGALAPASSRSGRRVVEYALALFFLAFTLALTSCAAPAAGERVMIEFENHTDKAVPVFIAGGPFTESVSIAPRERRSFWVLRAFIPEKIRVAVLEPSR